MDRKRIIPRLAYFSFLLSISLQLAADPMEDGLDAYKRGEKIEAKQYWLPLANNNNPKAQFYLSILYEQGLGGKEDNNLSLQWLKRASEGGYAPAQFNLGNLYIQGQRIVQSDKWAAHWWQKAAQQELLGAQFNLANLYALGRGVKKDTGAAKFWYAKAAAQGSEQASRALKQLSGEQPEKPIGGSSDNEAFVTAQSGALAGNAGQPVVTAEPKPALSSGGDSTALSQLAPGVQGDRVIGGSSDNQAVATALAGKAAQKRSKAPIRVSAKAGRVKNSTKQAVKAAPKPLLSSQGDTSAKAGRLWVLNQLPSHATIQLYASDRESSCRKQLSTYRSRFKLGVKTYNYRVKGKNFCALLYESFSSLIVAKRNIGTLPDLVRANKPWVRTFKSLQQKVR